jgi:hypothetical protein
MDCIEADIINIHLQGDFGDREELLGFLSHFLVIRETVKRQVVLTEGELLYVLPS